MFHNTNNNSALTIFPIRKEKNGKKNFYLGNGQWQTNKFPSKNRETLTRYLSTLKKRNEKKTNEN